MSEACVLKHLQYLKAVVRKSILSLLLPLTRQLRSIEGMGCLRLERFARNPPSVASVVLATQAGLGLLGRPLKRNKTKSGGTERAPAVYRLLQLIGYVYGSKII